MTDAISSFIAMSDHTAVATETTGSFTMRHALLVYERGHSSGIGVSVPALVTVHPVKSVDGRPEIGAGVEATDSFLRRLHVCAESETRAR